MKKLLFSILIVVILVSSAACYADGTTDQLMAMLQAKMEEVARLKSENESLRAQLEQCKAEKACDNSVITRQQPTLSAACTNQAEFIEDINYPDGTKVAPGERFTKIWRLRNTGTCTWTPGYKVVSVGRFNMGGQQYAYLQRNVRPGEMVDIAMDLSAPMYVGDYASEYRLEDENGNRFGIIGNVTKKELSFWLKINVVDKSKCALVNMNPASVWRNGEFDANITIKNNSGETWHAKDVDVRIKDGKDFLKYDRSYIDLPKSVDPGDTVTLIYDMIASDEGGNHTISLEFIKDGGVYCTVSSLITFK